MCVLVPLLFYSSMIYIVIPYLANASQGKELQLAIAGWRKHFKENEFHIVVVGDYDPVVDSGDDISFIDCPKIDAVKRNNYLPHIDHVHKFRKFLSEYPNADGFIYACDDMYAVNDFSFGDVKKLKLFAPTMKGMLYDLNFWRVDNAKTRILLESKGLPTKNYVCHLPVYYERDKLVSIWDKYDCDTTSRVVENLYFNTYHDADNNYPYKDFKYTVDYRTKGKVDELLAEMKTKIWVTNTVEGWYKEMEDILVSHYGL